MTVQCLRSPASAGRNPSIPSLITIDRRRLLAYLLFFPSPSPPPPSSPDNPSTSIRLYLLYSWLWRLGLSTIHHIGLVRCLVLILFASCGDFSGSRKEAKKQKKKDEKKMFFFFLLIACVFLTDICVIDNGPDRKWM